MLPNLLPVHLLLLVDEKWPEDDGSLLAMIESSLCPIEAIELVDKVHVLAVTLRLFDVLQW